MFDRGKVFKVEKNTIWIEFEPYGACHSCGICTISKSGNMVLAIENTADAKIGDWLEVEISPLPVSLAPFISFGLPVILFLAGVILGNFVSELVSVIAGLFFLFFGFMLVKMIDRYLNRSKKYAARIVKKME